MWVEKTISHNNLETEEAKEASQTPQINKLQRMVPIF